MTVMTETLSRSENGVTPAAAGGLGQLEKAAGSADDSVGSRPVVSIVLPYYNPGDRLRSTVEGLVEVLSASVTSFEIITVSDGSTDGSPFTLGGFSENVVRRAGYATNVGKGHALRTGLALSRGRYVGFIDADGDISPEFVVQFVTCMETENPDIVIGSKNHPESNVQWTPLRHFYSTAHQFMIRRLFRLSVGDTQVGIKLMDRRVVAEVLPLLRESRFALDLELLVLAQRLGYTRVVEAPVAIEERVGSTISLKRAWRLFADTVGLFMRLSVRHGYDPGIASRPHDVQAQFTGAPASAPVPLPAVVALPDQMPA